MRSTCLYSRNTSVAMPPLTNKSTVAVGKSCCFSATIGVINSVFPKRWLGRIIKIRWIGVGIYCEGLWMGRRDCPKRPVRAWDIFLRQCYIGVGIFIGECWLEWVIGQYFTTVLHTSADGEKQLLIDIILGSYVDLCKKMNEPPQHVFHHKTHRFFCSFAVTKCGGIGLK